jgi:hypothetical protein
MKRTILLLALTIMSIHAYSQTLVVQNIRGIVLDNSTKIPLTGAMVIIVGTDPVVGAVAGVDGEFEFKTVPVGRVSLKVSCMGYHEAMLSNLSLSSGKELFLTIELEEKVESLDEVVVYAHNRKDLALNELAQVSARTFSVENTERFAGSLGDPARMVANYAGVMTQNDSRNDIIIRGNSPIGVLWRIDGFEVPNPNHFSSMGSTGGPVGMINNNLLTNSDFMTGAFPAEYGNATSGVFDLNLRNGNNQKREYVGQVGFNGFELGAEGPFVQGGKSSYLINYRYSTLAVMHKLGYGTNTGTAVPYYQDLTFKFNFPTQKIGTFSLFGLGGKSDIDFWPDVEKGNAYNASDTRTQYGADLGVLGLKHSYFINNNTSITSRLSAQATQNYTQLDYVDTNLVMREPIYGGDMFDSKMSFSTEFKSRINPKNIISIGAQYDFYNFAYADSFYMSDSACFYTLSNTDGNVNTIRSFVQWQHKFNDDFTLYTGLHAMKFSMNNEFLVEPRLSIKWNINDKQYVSVGVGKHSQIQPRKVYFTETLIDTASLTYVQNNRKLKSTKSNHYVVGYNYLFTSDLRLKAEAYYQYLYDIPTALSEETFSLSNFGDAFYIPSYDSMRNDGKQKNYGIELTLEKFLNKGYYFLFTTSLFSSKYRTASAEWRNTAFNGNYVFNLLAGYEKKVLTRDYITIDMKAVWAGGRRYVPFSKEVLDQAKAVAENPGMPLKDFDDDEIYDYENSYKPRYNDYIRIDLRIGFKMNSPRVTQEWALDLQNLTNYQAIYAEEFNEKNGKITKTYQQGFYPMMLYRVQF